jgi:hypothetical protein
MRAAGRWTWFWRQVVTGEGAVRAHRRTARMCEGRAMPVSCRSNGDDAPPLKPLDVAHLRQPMAGRLAILTTKTTVIRIRVAWRQGGCETVADSASESRPVLDALQGVWSRQRHWHGNCRCCGWQRGHEGVCMARPKMWCGGCVTTTRGREATRAAEQPLRPTTRPWSLTGQRRMRCAPND